MPPISTPMPRCSPSSDHVLPDRRLLGGKRRWLIRGGVALLALPILWYFASRWCALAVDQVYTPRLAAAEIEIADDPRALS